MIIEEIKMKTPIKKTNIDDWWWSEASINPYNGCFHDCKYCDGKADSYYMHEEFSTLIKGKVNAPDFMERFLTKYGKIPANRKYTSTLVDYFPQTKQQLIKGTAKPDKFIIGVGGGVCDVYQPAEKELSITRQLLQKIYDYDFPVFILTKNRNVLRDINLLKRINDQSFANVGLSITLMNEKDRKIIEPHSSSTEDRFKAIESLRKAGIHAGVLFMPIIPWIGDSKENMESLFRRATEVDAEYIVIGGLTLKPGKNKQEFLKTIEQNYPNLLDKYEYFYANNDIYGVPNWSRAQTLGVTDYFQVSHALSKKYNIPIRMPRYLPKGRIKANLKVATILFKIAFLKTYVIKPKWSFAYKFRLAAQKIDRLEKNLVKMTDRQIKTLNLSKHVLPYVKEYIKTEQNSFLAEINEDRHLFYNP